MSDITSRVHFVPAVFDSLTSGRGMEKLNMQEEQKFSPEWKFHVAPHELVNDYDFQVSSALRYYTELHPCENRVYQFLGENFGEEVRQTFS